MDISKLLFPRYSSSKRRQQMKLLRVALLLGFMICVVLCAILYFLSKEKRFEMLFQR